MRVYITVDTSEETSSEIVSVNRTCEIVQVSKIVNKLLIFALESDKASIRELKSNRTDKLTQKNQQSFLKLNRKTQICGA